MDRTFTRYRHELLLCLFLITAILVEAKKRLVVATGETTTGKTDQDRDSIHYAVPFLVEKIGKEIYSAVNRPKYKFYIYMTIGKLPDERSTIIVLNMLCNILYGVAVFSGFMLLPRGYMLIGTALTIFIGPALILVLLGAIVLSLVVIALFPVISVFSMLVFFFLTSQIAQVMGRRLGLDHDKDGDVDMLDLLSYAASTQWGKACGLPKLHRVLNESMLDPFQEIHRRLDEIQRSTRTLNQNKKE
jgi:hypothetical protein